MDINLGGNHSDYLLWKVKDNESKSGLVLLISFHELYNIHLVFYKQRTKRQSQELQELIY